MTNVPVNPTLPIQKAAEPLDSTPTAAEIKRRRYQEGLDLLVKIGEESGMYETTAIPRRTR